MNAFPEPSRRRIRATEYQRMGEAGIIAPEERVELIEGEIIAMPPIGCGHAGLVNHLNHLLLLTLGDRAVVQVHNPLRLSDFSESEPDLSLLRPRRDFYRRAPALPEDTLLAIEVSDSTLAYDRRVKVPLYARHGVPETWLVDVQGERLTRHLEPLGGSYAREIPIELSIPLELVALPDVSVDLSPLFGDG